MRFRAELESTGGTTTGFQVPEEVVEALGGGGRPRVVATVNGHSFRTSIARMGGRYLLGVSADRRSAADVSAGDVLDVEVELDTAPRTVDVPEQLAAALAAEPAAKEFWNTLSYSNQQWHAQQISSAKSAETQARRVARSIEMLRARRPR
ncbi:YdeI/OmpD-associated family protein [Micromonospora chersina]|uniref:YdeI/OmpD-associated family protein n=1 Tax=Micromonospora chersina TaxID=47854 RepID=UPI0033FAC6F9